MLNSLSSKAMLTKARAMYGKRLTPENYQELLRMKSVRDVAAYLKTAPGYADALSNIYPDSIHRGQLELMLEKSLFQKYVRLSRYDITNKSSFLSFVISRFEVEQILRCIMFLNAGESESFISDLPGYLISHATFPIMRLAEVRSFYDLLHVLERTKYEDTIRRFVPNEGERIDYTNCDIALYTLYYDEMFGMIDRILKGKEKEELRELIKIQIELRNIATIFRLKNYFKADGDEIRKYLLPYRYKLREDKLDRLLKAESGDEILGFIRSSNYGRQLEGDRFVYIEDYMRQINAYYNKRIIRFSFNAPVVVYGFMELMQLELLNITNIIEGIRYNMSPENIRKLLIFL